jgi:hypothetical protein
LRAQAQLLCSPALGQSIISSRLARGTVCERDDGTPYENVMPIVVIAESSFHDYNIVAGRVWVLVLIWVVIAPYVFLQLQRQ